MVDVDVPALASCGWYHTIDLPSYGTQRGLWDIRGRFSDYTGHVPLAGRTVLDVGTASGFMTFEAERLGATVTSFDASDASEFHELPIRDAEYVRDPRAWYARKSAGHKLMTNGYWLAHHDLGSNARCAYGNVYDLDAAMVGGVFDVVLVGQILIHLRDAIRALEAIASVCRDTLVITEGSFANDTPIAALSGRAARPEISYAWYQYSTGWYREILAMLGFPNVQVAVGSYLCNDEHHANEIELTTFVATRS